MGVFDAWFGKRSDEPLARLDPKVREFLEKESPVKLDNKKAPDQDAAAQAEVAAAQAQAEAARQDAAAARSEKGVPEQSLYQDGRYAHLWKTYRPLSEIENETKSDEEKLRDVLEAYKSRKAAIGAAALENCADEQLDWSNCMRGGSLYARMTMCRDEVRKFERCYNMQSRLLKALGYLNSVDGSQDTDERIQLHADKLYHQMLTQEAAIEEAQKEGKPIPQFEPVIPKQIADAAAEDNAAKLSESAKKRVQDQLEKVSELERDAEQAAIDAETRAKAEMVDRIKNLWKEQEAERKARIEKGEETLWDKAATIFASSGGKKT
ncbi:hypothetical protein M406DRAFT_322615 [Cryphonectria parasitica EP155]|uniref:Autophagy protein n=1 Tax=Cryphonectria parasitica (strain ATCC 38755 / EP155) TaxID=660469 RepID=A0A9P5CNZ9_CRYP1|nr:uncharacterized protein M406DRAFT_322615 [Cryphonectria parasitica EP155]KAF3764465.1 hypothetical protein M406DRAFT_322615 [Cryphonectria parasitica EP155]